MIIFEEIFICLHPLYTQSEYFLQNIAVVFVSTKVAFDSTSFKLKNRVVT